MRDTVKFLLGQEIREIGNVDPTMTVLDYLRQVERRVGTKEGCAEGDCGACTVVLATPEDGRLRYRAVNSCIQFVPTLDGCQVITVEDLKCADGTLHPVQQAVVDCHGSQCGFCTPGFVMSLFALSRQTETAPEAGRIDDVLAGNLCRCTGYAPLVQAAHRMFELGPRDDDIAAREAEVLARLHAFRDQETLAVGDGQRRFLAPATADALAELLMTHPAATIVAGATDVGLWVTKEQRRLDPVIYLGRVAELGAIEETEARIEIGAGVTYADAVPALARHYPDMGEVIRRLGSVQIRNAGTLGGNIANGSPVADASPALIAAGATLHLRRGGERRAVPLDAFFLAYGEQDLRPSEFVERISVPKPEAGVRYRAYKISKRFDQDISAVIGAFRLAGTGAEVAELRLAFGGMAATPKRARHAEAAARGKPWTEATVEAAMTALTRDFTPISDLRASAAYRMKVAQNLLLKFYLETTDATVETRLVGDPGLAHV